MTTELKPTDDALASLLASFNPQKAYAHGPFEIRVENVFLRVDEALKDQLEFDRNKAVIAIGFNETPRYQPEAGDRELTVQLIDLLQDPLIARSAWVSTGREENKIAEGAKKLIGRLYKDFHATPFEGGVMIKFFVRTPICYAENFFQLPGTHNEFSGRYSKIDGPFYTPDWARDNSAILKIFEESELDSKAVYSSLLEARVAKEQARFSMLFRFHTNFFWTVSLRHLLEFLALERNELVPDELWDMRDNLFPQFLSDWFPWAYESFLKYPKKIPTTWYRNFAEETDHFQAKLKDTSIERERIKNIGELYLCSVHRQEDVERLGFLTKPNPRRGFGHSSMTFLIKDPIFVHRQWVRHRYGVWGEIPPDFDAIVLNSDFYVPDHFRQQVGKTMDYTFEEASHQINEELRSMLSGLIHRSRKRYQTLRQTLPPEKASLILPYVFRVHRLWTVNIESIMNYFSLRCDDHAQWETRMFAYTAYTWFKKHFPWENTYFLKYFNFGKCDLFE